MVETLRKQCEALVKSLRVLGGSDPDRVIRAFPAYVSGDDKGSDVGVGMVLDRLTDDMVSALDDLEKTETFIRGKMKQIGVLIGDGVVTLRPVKSEGPVCKGCGADLTKASAVARVYHLPSTKDEQDPTTTGLGHYLSDGTFEPDGKPDVPVGDAQTFDGDDTCDVCGAVVG